MKPMMGLVALLGSVAACAPQSECAEGEICGRVVEGEDARLSREDAVSLDVAIFWHYADPGGSRQYTPMVVASVTGSVPVDFSNALPVAPPDEAMIGIEDSETGVVDPDAGLIATGGVYLTASGAVEENPEGVNSLDVDLVLGMARTVGLFYTPVDLDSTARIHALHGIDQPLDAGYHLFVEGVEVDLTTPIEAELGYVEE